MKRIFRTPDASRGFSLIEVMIAVVVLATGLLALAALQGSLTRSSAEAKVRSRIATMLSARMDELRGSGYENTVLDPGSQTTGLVDDCDGDSTDWFDCARVEANLGSLTVVQTNELWTSAMGDAAFSEAGSRADVEDGNPEFIRVTLSANWSDSTGDNHSLAMTSEFSSLALRDSLLPPPPATGAGTGAPIVRTDNPAGPGVIPIAMGAGDATAASNPRPELVGKSTNNEVTGTRFDVLTYSGLTGAAAIQRRVETAVIKCQCSLGAGGMNLPEIYRKSEWPAIWTGERYDVYKPSPAIDAPGQGKNSGPKPGVNQSALCLECCRDHFDGDTAGVAKFDPERSGAHQHYKVDGATGALTIPGATDVDYVEACRIIRVDGFWRTSADMYSRQFGLLATETINYKEAASGVPDEKATADYEQFVKDYLSQITGVSGTPPTNAQVMYDEPARYLNDPDYVDVPAPSATDYRYLHGRGLYLDFLEKRARERITAVLADTGPNGACPTGSDVAECILPYLPFTTINVTELASWQATDTNILSVNSGNLLGTNPSQPSGGRTVGVNRGIASNVASSGKSNFGVAGSSDPLYYTISGIDPEDAALHTDAQPFNVAGDLGKPHSGDEFTVRITGATTQDPNIFYKVGSSGLDIGECFRARPTLPYRCATNTPSISGGYITLSNYWVEGPDTKRTHTHECLNTTTNTVVTVTATVNTPTFHDYEVTSARIAGVYGTLAALSNDHKTTESATYHFPTLLAGNIIDVTLAEQAGSPLYATVASCTTTGNGNTMTVNNWNKTWVP